MYPLLADQKSNNNNDNHQGAGSLRAFINQPASNGAPAINGTFDIKRFAASDDRKTLNAIGILSVTDGTRTVVTTTAIPVMSISPQNQNAAVNTATAAIASCPILHLVLGPLNLNLLGLNVTLNQVILDITAIPGPGNLLGNLLCDIAGLLNPGGALTGALQGLAAALNNLLAALGL
jgi:hypothetical protein